MGKSKSRKIYISCAGVVYKFITYLLQDSDGSFYITLQRDGNNNEYVKFSSETQDLKYIPLNGNREKTKKISYHSSGRVNYHHVDNPSIFFEPLSKITEINFFASQIIPSIYRLDPFEGKLTAEDFLIEFANDSENIQFNLFIAPWDVEIKSEHVAVRYKKLFAFILEFSQPFFLIPDELNDHFTFISPKEGLFANQALDNNSALVSFHQKKLETNNLILYSPNKEGIYTIIHSKMRIPPIVTIGFLKNDLMFEIVSQTGVVIKFKVLDKHGNNLKHEEAIINIALNSEL